MLSLKAKEYIEQRGNDTFSYDLKHGINPTLKNMIDYRYAPYDITMEKLPDGYSIETIKLGNSRGFMQKYKGGSDKIIYQVHGGGYVTTYGPRNTIAAIMHSKVYGNADVFSIDYRVASQAKFPAAFDDVLEGYKYLLNMGYKNIVCVGNSAGAGLIMALCLYLRNNNITMPHKLVLGSPWVNLKCDTESYKKNMGVDILFGSLREDGETSLPAYLYSDDLENPYVSPVFGEFDGLPPVQIHTGGDEMMIDDSIAIKDKYDKLGLLCELYIYPKMWHAFYSSNIELEESELAYKRIEEFLNK